MSRSARRQCVVLPPVYSQEPVPLFGDNHAATAGTTPSKAGNRRSEGPDCDQDSARDLVWRLSSVSDKTAQAADPTLRSADLRHLQTLARMNRTEEAVMPLARTNASEAAILMATPRPQFQVVQSERSSQTAIGSNGSSIGDAIDFGPFRLLPARWRQHKDDKSIPIGSNDIVDLMNLIAQIARGSEGKVSELTHPSVIHDNPSNNFSASVTASFRHHDFIALMLGGGKAIGSLFLLLRGEPRRPTLDTELEPCAEDGSARWQKRYAPEAIQSNKSETAELLSERERNIINLISHGRSNKEVARDLGISPETVKSHVKNIFAKLEVDKRTQAVSRAKSLGLLSA